VEAGGIFKSDRASSNFDCFQAKTSGSIKANITAGGAATFAGDVISGGDAYNGANNGCRFYSPGQLLVSRTGGTNTVFEGYTTGNSTPTSKITAAGAATFAGVVTCSSLTETSDQRFKKDITEAGPQLSDVVALGSNLRNWSWNEAAPVSDKETRFLGVIAQEVEGICPGLIHTIERTKDGAELTPEVTVPAVYETIEEHQELVTEAQIIPAEVDADGQEITAEEIIPATYRTIPEEQRLVTAEKITPATYEQVDDSYKTIKTSVLVMKLLGAVAELTAKVEALEEGRAAS